MEGVRPEAPPDVWIVLDTLLDEPGSSSQQQTLEQRVEELMTDHDDAKRLQAIPGVEKIIAATILAETADIERFPNARAFAAYTGLVPRVRSSAGKAKLGNITRSGPPGSVGRSVTRSSRASAPSTPALRPSSTDRKAKPRQNPRSSRNDGSSQASPHRFVDVVSQRRSSVHRGRGNRSPRKSRDQTGWVPFIR
ncbi:MAG: IS110 family transposase [Planctomycetes bacterium]|nr:IS110 family transposase [Planctomycetota bacterium]